MADIKAFGAMRFTKKAGELSQLVCPPYDIISEAQREQYLKTNPHNIIRLELPREGAEPYGQAGKTLREWFEDGILACDEKPGLYIYEEEFDVNGVSKKIKGLVCRVKLESFDKGVVLPHEETLSKAKTDRFNLMCATNCNFSSIYSLYFDENGSAFSQIEALSAGEPDVAFDTEDGITHRVWCVYDKDAVAALTAVFADKKLYIADGHHRYETALNYQKHLKDEGSIKNEGHPANAVMMTLVNMEHPGLVVFPTHRIIRGLTDFSIEKLLEGCKKYFMLEDCETEVAEARLEALARDGKKAFGLYGGGKTTVLIFNDASVMGELLPDMSDAYRGLDVSILHTLILERLLGIDKENMANQKNLIYTRDIAEAVAAVDNKEADCAFIINSTRVDEIASVAGAGEKMPQKSTYFYPKLITGHLMNSLEEK